MRKSLLLVTVFPLFLLGQSPKDIYFGWWNKYVVTSEVFIRPTSDIYTVIKVYMDKEFLKVFDPIKGGNDKDKLFNFCKLLIESYRTSNDTDWPYKIVFINCFGQRFIVSTLLDLDGQIVEKGGLFIEGLSRSGIDYLYIDSFVKDFYASLDRCYRD